MDMKGTLTMLTSETKGLVGDALMFLTAMLLGAAVSIAAFVYVLGKYVQPVPMVIDTCPQPTPKASPPTLRMT